MHIPDGFISGTIAGSTAVISLVALTFCISSIKKENSQKKFIIPLLATLAAFVFAAQMLNFPIGGGTSGHFLGAALAAALLGPWSGCLILSLVLIIQSLFFGDGGITALGANILNMGIIAGIVMYPIMRGLRGLLPVGKNGYLISVGITSWFSVVLASTFCAFELALSGTSPLSIALPAMVGTHAIIGLGEAMISIAVLTSIIAARPDIIPAWALLDSTVSVNKLNKNVRGLAAAGMALALALAVFGSPFASSSPDGLEKVAEDKGFLQAASEETVFWNKSLFPDYAVTSIQSEKISTGTAGLFGTMLVFAFGFGLIRMIVREPSKERTHSLE